MNKKIIRLIINSLFDKKENYCLAFKFKKVGCPNNNSKKKNLSEQPIK
jgi:hypothetical protein